MTGGSWGWGSPSRHLRRSLRCETLEVMVGGGTWAQLPSFVPLRQQLRAKLRRNLSSRSFLPQPHEELEHWASSPKDLSPQPQGPSLLMLQALRELDLTACSRLTDASLTKV